MTAILRERPEALLVAPTPLNLHLRREIAEFAVKSRLPSVAARRQEALAGDLLSYGPSLAAMLARTAVFVDKIFKGAKPAELPVEQPTKFEFVINLIAAKALGLTVLQGLLLQADGFSDTPRSGHHAAR